MEAQCRRLRVLHAPGAVGGHPPALARIERRNGLDSWCVTLGQSFTNYPVDESIETTGLRRLAVPYHRARLLWRALKSFDVIHFNFGCSILPFQKNLGAVQRGVLGNVSATIYNALAGFVELKDVAWLKRAGKTIAVTFQGDDARIWSWCRENYQYTPSREIDMKSRVRNDDLVRWRIDVWDRYADIIYALNPDLLQVLPARARFFPYAHPDVTAWTYRGVDVSERRPLRIVHAPSNRVVKGTKYLMSAVERLRAEGLEFEFILVENLSNAEARCIYESADVLVDQLLCGWYGGVSAEFMALGKVVVCYLREEDLRFLPPGMAVDMPLLNANPDTITGVLRRVIAMPRTELAEVGRRSRAWVERWHSPAAIGERVKSDYDSAHRKQDTV